MKTTPRRKLTIAVEDAVYRGLRKVVYQRNISRSFNDFARPHALRTMLKAETNLSAEFLCGANALSALYPNDSREKRFLDATLLATPR